MHVMNNDVLPSLEAQGAVIAVGTTTAPGWAMLLFAPLLAVLVWWLGIFTREEITAVLAKLGIPCGRTPRHVAPE